MSEQGVGLLSNLAEVEEEASEIQEGVAVHRRNAEHAATRYLIADDATQDDSLGLRGTKNTARDANMSRSIVGLPYRFRRFQAFMVFVIPRLISYSQRAWQG